MEHKIAVVVWNEFIAKTNNEGIDFSFNNLEKRIKETINEALSQHDVSELVCPKCNSENMSSGTGKIGTCFDCYHIWQTVH